MSATESFSNREIKPLPGIGFPEFYGTGAGLVSSDAVSMHADRSVGLPGQGRCGLDVAHHAATWKILGSRKLKSTRWGDKVNVRTAAESYDLVAELRLRPH
jgi:hypothetical protein